MLSVAILLISTGKSVAEISKIIERELKEIGLSLRVRHGFLGKA